MNILNKHKKAVLLLVGIIVSTLPTFATIYEDAEDLKTTGWEDTTHNLNTTIANIYDSQKESRVIELRGNGKNTMFGLGATESVNSNSWNNSTEKQLKWSMNYSESFSIYIPISTEKGKRFLVYTNQGTDKKGKIRGGKVRYGLGEDSIDGTWHTFTRDLEADWNAFEPDNPYIKVHGFFIRGSGRVDDISLSQKAIEPTTENNSTDWVVYGDTTDAIIETVEDIERGSSVIKLTAHGENTGFRLGNRAGRASYVGAWHNQTEKILQWSMKYDEPFTIYIPITTEHGNRFLTYTNQSEDKKGKVRGGKVSYGLGEDSIDGTWHTFTRDLEADWNAFMPNDPFVAVNGFFIKGSGYVADVMTLNSSNPPIDSVKPIISLLGNANITLTVGDTYTDAGATATDDVDGDITADINITSNVNTSVAGIYHVHYNVKDSSGNMANEVIREVKVEAVTTCDLSTAITRSQLRSMIENREDISGVNTCAITDMSYLFSPYPTYYEDFGEITYDDNGYFNLNGWDVSNVTNMEGMFKGVRIPDGTEGIISIDKWNVSNVRNMRDMFKNMNAGASDLSDWNVSNVTNMSGMFQNYIDDQHSGGTMTSSFAKWDVSNVTDMSFMFYGMYQPIGLEDWNVSNVRDMSYMFYNARYFNDAIGNWDVSNVTNMEYMFAGEGAFSREYNTDMHFNQPIGNWNVSNVKNMERMFWYSTAFNQDISGWNISNVTNYEEFKEGAPLDDAHNPFIVSSRKPVIKLLGDALVFLKIGDTYTDAGATAMDDVDGNITANIQVTGLPIDTSIEGNYTITYEVSDSEGNNANIITRIIKVTNNIINLNDGLIAYYKFEGNANDSSGNGHDGIEYGGVSYTNGVIGQALKLDGSSRINLASFSDTNVARGLTYSYWFKKYTARPEAVFSQYTWYNNGHVFYHAISNTNIYATSFLNLQGTSSNGLTALYSEDFQWHHVVVNSTSNKLQLWLDGALVKEVPKVEDPYITNSSIQTYIGDTGLEGDGSDKHFRGELDDFRVYNRGLSPQEIEVIFNQGAVEG